MTDAIPLDGNLLENLPEILVGESFQMLLACRNVQIERIVSSDAPETVLYDQVQDEWVLLVQGEADLWIDGGQVTMRAGDFRFIPAHTPHRVLRTSTAPRCIWLAVHIHP